VQKTFVEKAAWKMLVKLTPAVNFTNILGPAFVPIYFLLPKKYKPKLCKAL